MRGHPHRYRFAVQLRKQSACVSPRQAFRLWHNGFYAWPPGSPSEVDPLRRRIEWRKQRTRLRCNAKPGRQRPRVSARPVQLVDHVAVDEDLGTGPGLLLHPSTVLKRVGSSRGCGVNVGSRVIRAGFTSTRWVLASAVPSASVGNPASCLGVRGSMLVVVGVAPTGEIRRGVEVAIHDMSATTCELPISQRKSRVSSRAHGAELARRVPAVRDHEQPTAPGLLIAQHGGELCPSGRYRAL